MNICLLCFPLVCATLLGCVSAPSNLPRGARLVGGGLQIEYSAPENGTAILRERSTGKIVATQSLEPGDDFDFTVTRQENAEVLRSLFATTNAPDIGQLLALPTNVCFELYFTPVKKKAE